MKTIDSNAWEVEDPSQAESKNIDSFPEEWKDEFEGLLFLGHLQREITSIPMHKFVIRTLTVNDQLEVSLVAKPYLETIGYGRAYKSAIVAASLVEIDGRPFISPKKNNNMVQQKFDYLTNNWHDIVVDTLYNEQQALENKVVIVLQELNIIEPVIPLDIFEQEETSTDTPKDGN